MDNNNLGKKIIGYFYIFNFLFFFLGRAKKIYFVFRMGGKKEKKFGNYCTTTLDSFFNIWVALKRTFYDSVGWWFWYLSLQQVLEVLVCSSCHGPGTVRQAVDLVDLCSNSHAFYSVLSMS